MESVKTLNKGLALDTFKVLSATAALSLSLIVYAMHDYFNLFGAAHAIVFTVLVFYGLAAAGYYMLCLKNADKYELPTVATRVVSLIFYTSVGVAVFFAYKIYINSALDYAIAFFAGCIAGGIIKDVTSFAVSVNNNEKRCLSMLLIPLNLFFVLNIYVGIQYNEGVLTQKFIWAMYVPSVVLYALYYSIKKRMVYPRSDSEAHIVVSSILINIMMPLFGSMIGSITNANLLFAIPLAVLVVFVISLLTHIALRLDFSN